MESQHDLHKSTKERLERIELEEARRLIKLARSSNSADTDQLMIDGMTRGLRHPRFAVEAIQAELSVKIAQRVLWATVAAAVASVASAIAAIAAVAG
jgi:hypothetical protein